MIFLEAPVVLNKGLPGVLFNFPERNVSPGRGWSVLSEATDGWGLGALERGGREGTDIASDATDREHGVAGERS